MNELNDVLTPEFELKLSKFFNEMPESAYHAENGVIEAFSEKKTFHLSALVDSGTRSWTVWQSLIQG